MNVFARIEHACARVVEDAFARVFPSALEPAQIGRRLIATAQAQPSDVYLVRVHPSDYARLEPDRAFLEARWSAMLHEANPAATPRVVLDEDAGVVAGSLAIVAVLDTHAESLALQSADGKRTPLAAGLTIGRDAGSGFVLRDPRVSRLHARIVADGDGLAIEDAGSSNGTFVDGERVRRAALRPGSRLTVGDTILQVVAR